MIRIARYVVLDFRNNEFADKFVDLVDGNLSWEELAAVAGAFATVEAVFAKPTMFCACGVEYSAGSYQKSKTFGWFVHLKCRKTRKEWGENIKCVLGQATDLLPKMREGRNASTEGDN